jgi:hypothetical protein
MGGQSPAPAIRLIGGDGVRAGGVDELLGERLDPPVDAHGIDVDATLGQQLLDLAVGQPVTQLPTHRDCDDLAREAVTR